LREEKKITGSVVLGVRKGEVSAQNAGKGKGRVRCEVSEGDVEGQGGKERREFKLQPGKVQKTKKWGG